MRATSLLLGVTALFAGSIHLAACGSDVSTDEASGSASGAATSSGEGSAASSASSGGEGGAGGGQTTTPIVCGGFAGSVCPPDAWCDFPDGLCGGDDGTGECKPKPQACDADCPGVCGCDGTFYCNACEAQVAGVDTGDLVSCTPPGSGEYKAQAYFGAVDHLWLRKADKARDVCVLLHITHPGMSSPELSSLKVPDEWGVAQAFITHKASDCDSTMGPSGKVVQATGGAGAITLNLPPGKYLPCDVSVHGELSFPQGEPWVMPKEPLDADKVLVEDGCQ